MDDVSKLQVNDDKAKLDGIRPNNWTQTFNCTFISFHFISFSNTAENQEFYTNGVMRYNAHVQHIYPKAYNDVRRIIFMCHLLSIDETKTLVSAFVCQKLVYCSTFFHASQLYILEGLQKVKNSAAWQRFQCCKRNYISPILTYLHWLAI